MPNELNNPCDGWKLQQLTDGAATGLASVHSYFDQCAWSPDGKKVAFCRYWPNVESLALDGIEGMGRLRRPLREGEPGMEVCWMDVASGEINVVATHSLIDTHNVVALQWLPSGNALAFLDYDESEQRGLTRIVDIDSAAERVLEGPLTVVHPRSNLAIVIKNTAWGESAANPAGLWILDLDSGAMLLVVTFETVLNALQGTPSVAANALGMTHAKWSPDGRRVLFVVRDAGKPVRVKALFTVNADGSNLRHQPIRPEHMMWHPDGQRIMSSTKAQGGRAVLSLLDVDSGSVATIADPHPGSGGASHPSYHPDGKRIVLEKFSPLSTRDTTQLCELLLFNSESGEVDRLAVFPVIHYGHHGIHVHPGWSRDGDAIIYNSDQTGQSELYMISGFGT